MANISRNSKECAVIALNAIHELRETMSKISQLKCKFKIVPCMLKHILAIILHLYQNEMRYDCQRDNFAKKNRQMAEL